MKIKAKKPGTWEILKKPGILNEITKIPGILNNFYMLSSKTLIWLKKSTIWVKNIIKKHFKVAIQYLFNVFILISIVSNLKLRFKLKVYPKTCTFKHLEEVSQTKNSNLEIDNNIFSVKNFNIEAILNTIFFCTEYVIP